MQTIEQDDFSKAELRVGSVISAEPFAAARKPAYILQVDSTQKSAPASPVHRSPRFTAPNN